MLQIIEKRNTFTEALNKKSHYSKRNLESLENLTGNLRLSEKKKDLPSAKEEIKILRKMVFNITKL